MIVPPSVSEFPRRICPGFFFKSILSIVTGLKIETRGSLEVHREFSKELSGHNAREQMTDAVDFIAEMVAV